MDHRSHLLISGIILLFFVTTLVFYKHQRIVLYGAKLNSTNDTKGKENLEQIVEKEEIHKPSYPHCMRNDSADLLDLIMNLVDHLSMCSLSEMISMQCERPAFNAGRVRGGMMVIYAAVVLLLVSLGAAVVEVWRVRKRAVLIPSPNGRDPPQLSRRCSLADLTVLRHNRRESMLRRDSSWYMSLDDGSPVGNVRQHKVPLKQLGSSKSQDEGRSVSKGSKASKWQRSVSADKADEQTFPVHHHHHHHRVHIIHHH